MYFINNNVTQREPIKHTQQVTNVKTVSSVDWTIVRVGASKMTACTAGIIKVKVESVKAHSEVKRSHCITIISQLMMVTVTGLIRPITQFSFYLQRQVEKL